jgi:hypothetical protein
MSIRLKRIVFFFCILNFGLGGCLSTLAMAQIDPFRIWIPGVAKDVNSLKRVVSGYVFEEGGVGVSNVGIYDGSKLLAVTDQRGDYLAYILRDVQYTLTPKKDDFDFVLRSWIIPANGDDYHQINFKMMPYPRPVTLLSPSGTIYSSTPTYKWIASSLATSYWLHVDDSIQLGKIIKLYTDYEAGCASGTCSVTPSTNLADGSGAWWVEACISNLCGGQSNHMIFIVSAGLPGAATLISPSGMISSSTPTYRWIPVPNATSYKLQVKDSIGGVKIDKKYTDSEANCASGTCSVTPTTNLADGSATWSIVACNQYYGDTGGCGPSSDTMGFVIDTPEVVISGKLIWNYGSSDPLPIVAIKAYAQDGSYFRSATTSVDGSFSFSVPFNWTGSVKPDNVYYVFDPDKVNYYSLQADLVQNYWISKKP